MTDGHHITINFDMLGDIPSIEERLKILVGFAHDLNARRVHGTIDANDYRDRLDRVISDLKILNVEYLAGRAPSIKEDVGLLYALSTTLNHSVIHDINLNRALCEDTATATPDQCKRCPNVMGMPDGGIMCVLSKRNISGVF